VSRALELFNKTNQFNTTGQRYTLEQFHQRFAAGQELYVVQAEDRFTQYGLVGAAWVRQQSVSHVVMSCRALGLGIEDALLACIGHRLARQKAGEIFGCLQLTATNTACRPYFSRNGFTQLAANPVLWSRSLRGDWPLPPHLSLSIDGEETAAENETGGRPVADMVQT
jgi:FkbH-like protein